MSIENMDKLAAYWEGWDSYLRGESMQACPHEADNPLYSHWQNGWEDCQVSETEEPTEEVW